MKQENITQQSSKRRLKIHRKYILRSYHRYVIFPEIRLCGKWLQDIGFHCGNFVTVEHQQNKIIITNDNEMETIHDDIEIIGELKPMTLEEEKKLNDFFERKKPKKLK